MKKIFLKLFLLILPFAVVIPLVNYFVDPAKKFASEDYVKGVAAIMLQGHNVYNVANYDQRLLQKYILLGQKTAPNVIVLGSSRIMELGMDAYTDSGLRVINCAVSHGSIRDIVAVTGIIDSLKLMPQKLIINVDPYFLIGGTDEWESIKGYYDHILPKLMKPEEYPPYKEDRYKDLAVLISVDYFKSSMEKLAHKADQRYYDVGTKRPDFGRYADGSICYPLSYMHPTDTLKIMHDAAITAKQEPLPAPVQVYDVLFDRLLTYLAEKNVTVELVMAPYNPVFYNTENQNKGSITFIEVEKRFRDIAAAHHIRIVGSLDPAVFCFHQAEYYDMYHCSRSALQTVVHRQ